MTGIVVGTACGAWIEVWMNSSRDSSKIGCENKTAIIFKHIFLYCSSQAFQPETAYLRKPLRLSKNNSALKLFVRVRVLALELGLVYEFTMFRPPVKYPKRY